MEADPPRWRSAPSSCRTPARRCAPCWRARLLACAAPPAPRTVSTPHPAAPRRAQRPFCGGFGPRQKGCSSQAATIRRIPANIHLKPRYFWIRIGATWANLSRHTTHRRRASARPASGGAASPPCHPARRGAGSAATATTVTLTVTLCGCGGGGGGAWSYWRAVHALPEARRPNALAQMRGQVHLPGAWRRRWWSCQRRRSSRGRGPPPTPAAWRHTRAAAPAADDIS
jgi:hypothetical protein